MLDSTQAWRVDPTATWTVVADVADAASALSVLDPDLADLVDGQFGRETACQLRATATCGIGLLAKLTAEVARRGPLHSRLDHLVRASVEPVNPRPLRDFTDAAAGQPRVARMLHQRQGILPVKALGPAVVGQARIATEIAAAARSLQEMLEPDVEYDSRQQKAFARLPKSARDRARALTQMARSRKAVADIMHGGEPVVWQVGEILRAVQRRPRPTHKADAQRQLRDLDQVAARGDAVNRLLVQGIEEAFATGQYLVPHPEAERLQWRPCRPDGNPSLRQAARDLGCLLEEDPLLRQLEPGQRRSSTIGPHSGSQQLVDAVEARTPCRRSSPGMRIRHPLSP